MKKADIILVAVVLGAAAISLFIGNFIKKDGSMVFVSVDGVCIEKFSLDEECVYEIIGADGGKNILEIKDHKAHLTEADCPDLLCVKQGSISKVGESIICLPHKVVIEIVGKESDQSIDAVTK